MERVAKCSKRSSSKWGMTPLLGYIVRILILPNPAFLLSTQPKATFISEVEVIRAEMLEKEVVIEGEYASSETMRSWGFTELSICN